MTAREQEILKQLGGRLSALCYKKDNLDHKRLCKAINQLKPERPVIFVHPEGSWKELIPEETLQCEDKLLRDWERIIRRNIYSLETIQCDWSVEPVLNINWDVKMGHFGFDVEYTHGGGDGGSYVWEAPLKDLDKDFAKLKYRDLSVDREATYKKLELAKKIFGDTLNVRIRGEFWWTMGLTWEVIRLIGLENIMLYMYDQPDNLKRLMNFMAEEHVHMAKWLEKEGLFTPTNEDDYVGSGSAAYTDDLPQQDWKPGDKIRTKDIWTLSESQETVGVGPEMFEEFILPYQKSITDHFGLVYYGCCEGLHLRIDRIIKAMPNLRAVSVSPWADQEIMAQKLGMQYVYSRKPNPSMIAVQFHEDQIRKDLEETLRIAGKLPLQIIMKDLHTIQNDPTRISRWVKIAREEIEKIKR